jgi:hypothetical protein
MVIKSTKMRRETQLPPATRQHSVARVSIRATPPTNHCRRCRRHNQRSNTAASVAQHSKAKRRIGPASVAHEQASGVLLRHNGARFALRIDDPAHAEIVRWRRQCRHDVGQRATYVDHKLAENAIDQTNNASNVVGNNEHRRRTHTGRNGIV